MSQEERLNFNELLMEVAEAAAVVGDADTRTLLYMNQAAKSIYQVPEDGYVGKRCYETLRGQSEPCPDCPLEQLSAGEVFRWEQHDAQRQRWLDNTVHLLEREERRLYVKTARDITVRKRDSVLPADQPLTQEDTVFRCLDIMSGEQNFDQRMKLFLETVGRFYQADRVSVFQADGEKQTMLSRYDWHAGKGPGRSLPLERIPMKLFAGGDVLPETARVLYFTAADAERDLGPQVCGILKRQRVESIMVAPFLDRENELTGLLAVENPRGRPGNLELLRSVADLIRTGIGNHELLAELEVLCYTDQLTGVQNRQQFTRCVRDLERKPPESLGVALVSINGMKSINAEFGMDRGDEVLCRISRLIQSDVSGLIFRVSGDEFAALCPGMSEDDFQAMVSALRRSFRANEDGLVSMGCAWTDEEADVGELIQQAQDLMFAEKQNYYTDILKSGQTLRKTPAEAVLREIERGSFMVYFQPQINLSTGLVVGAEALVRKTEEDGTLIFPDKFIPFYETAGVIRYVDLHVLEMACAAMRGWKREDLTLRVSVNFSRQTLMEPEIVETVGEICGRYGVSPSEIMIEVTENISKIQPAHLQKLILALRERGFAISLDDFGSSYSNLAILSAIEFDEVKFDRTLVQNIETNRKSQTVMRNGIRMCEELDGSESVAEGIETEEQLRLLKSFGCRVGQGYYFSRPIAPEPFLALLRERKHGWAAG